MKKYMLLSVVVVFMMGAQMARSQGGDAAAGKPVYNKACATCHGTDGAPKEAIAKMLKVDIPHLGSKEVQAKSDADLKKVITDGYQKMKPVKGLSDKDVSNVVAFMRTLKTS
jgi:cytochrome c553